MQSAGEFALADARERERIAIFDCARVLHRCGLPWQQAVARAEAAEAVRRGGASPEGPASKRPLTDSVDPALGASRTNAVAPSDRPTAVSGGVAFRHLPAGNDPAQGEVSVAAGGAPLSGGMAREALRMATIVAVGVLLVLVLDRLESLAR